jgi:hypothetical protein
MRSPSVVVTPAHLSGENLTDDTFLTDDSLLSLGVWSNLDTYSRPIPSGQSPVSRLSSRNYTAEYTGNTQHSVQEIHSRISAPPGSPEAYRSRFNALDPLSPNSFLLRTQTIMSGAPKSRRHRATQPNQRPLDASMVSPATGSDGRGRRGFATGAIRRAPPTSAPRAGMTRLTESPYGRIPATRH